MTREEASNYCLSNFDVRYPLATIRSQADLSAVQNACSGGDCWIGLKNPKYKDAFATLGLVGNFDKIKDFWREDQIWDETGTNYPQTDFWAKGEPNNGGAIVIGTGTEECVAFWAGAWKDSPCDRRNRFVCGPRPPDCGCEYMTVSGKEYSTVADGIGDAKGAYCRSDHDDYGRCCCNAGFGCQSGADFCALPASAAAVSALEQHEDPTQPPALIAMHSTHVPDRNYCCQARTVDGWNGNWNGVCWGEQTEADCNSNGRKCEWTPDECRSELNCLLRDAECQSDEDCCSGRCKVGEKLCR